MMVSTRATMVLFVVLAASCLPAKSRGTDIVKDGKPMAVIVKQEVTGAFMHGQQKRRTKKRGGGFACNDKTAARVLADWIEKITDVRLRIVSEAPNDRPVIYVGAAAIRAGLNLDDKNSPTGEGLRIISDGRTKILIAGQNETSTVKAVCRFLEELGCRYFMDNDVGEVYPRTKTVTVGRLNITGKPGFMLRRIWGSQWSRQNLWKVWNGAGGLPMSTGHAWGKYVDDSLFETHPEYFALRDGKRRKGDWYCTSNPELRRIFAQGVISRGGYNPSVSPPDGTGYCQCDRCRSQDNPSNIEPSSGMPSVTNRYMDFLDKAAMEVAKVHPGSPNSASRMQLAEVIDGWADVAKHIAYRTYNYNLAECLVPFSKLSVWKHDIPYLKERGCIGINLESLVNWEIYGPHLYQSIRLAYNPDADSNALMDDYFMKFYGPKAGPFMKQYWMSIDNAFANMKCESGSLFALHLVYTPRFLKELHSLVQKARSDARGNKLYEARVAMMAQGLKNAVQYIQIRDAMNRGDFAKAKKIYNELYVRNEVELSKGYGNHYTLNYLERFLGKHVIAGANATTPPDKVLQVLPDRMKLRYDLDDKGTGKGYHRPDFDDSKWEEVATYSNTLNTQGLPDIKSIMWYRTSINILHGHGRLALFFTEVDGRSVAVYVNGIEVALVGNEARRKPFEVDINDAVKPGENVVAVKIDHSKITELFLGGIIRPVLLIEKAM